MNNLMNDCKSLTSVPDLSLWNTQNVFNKNNAFSYSNIKYFFRNPVFKSIIKNNS